MSKYKLDLNTVLSRIDTKDRKWFASLSAEERKSFAGIVMLRYMSSGAGAYGDYCLLASNEANKHFHEMWEHPELQYLLLTATS